MSAMLRRSLYVGTIMLYLFFFSFSIFVLIVNPNFGAELRLEEGAKFYRGRKVLRYESVVVVWWWRSRNEGMIWVCRPVCSIWAEASSFGSTLDGLDTVKKEGSISLESRNHGKKFSKINCTP